jgi:hypothetical protein
MLFFWKLSYEKMIFPEVNMGGGGDVLLKVDT